MAEVQGDGPSISEWARTLEARLSNLQVELEQELERFKKAATEIADSIEAREGGEADWGEEVEMSLQFTFADRLQAILDRSKGETGG